LGKKEGTKNGSQKKEKRVHVKNGEFFGAWGGTIFSWSSITTSLQMQWGPIKQLKRCILFTIFAEKFDLDEWMAQSLTRKINQKRLKLKLVKSHMS
jgi:hypothetical protein